MRFRRERHIEHASHSRRLAVRYRQDALPLHAKEKFIASTRTPGITISADGRRFIDKRYHGVRIGMRIGSVTQEQAEQRLHTQIQRVDLELAERAQPRPLLRDCAARYLDSRATSAASKQSKSTCAY